MGVATGTFQYPNGSPVANGQYQFKLSQDAINSPTTCVSPVLIRGNLDANGNLTATFLFNDVLSTSAGLTTYYQLTVKGVNGGQVWNENYQLTGTAANLNTIPPLGSGTGTIISSGPALPPAQVGDTIRFSTKGDTLWDAVNFMQKVVGVYAVSNGLQMFGVTESNAPTQLGATSAPFPTLTDGWARVFSTAASASTLTTMGTLATTNGNNVLFGILSFYRYSCRFAAGQTTNVRYWIGLGNYNVSGVGGNATAILGTTAYAADLPNKTTIAFRYSSGTDTTWKAVSIVAGGGSTVVDTGIAPDTNTHLFEMATNQNGTAVIFLIDGVSVATISINLPNPAAGYDSLGGMFWTGDNKNTANTTQATWYWTQMSQK